jgi:hypothetical protein
MGPTGSGQRCTASRVLEQAAQHLRELGGGDAGRDLTTTSSGYSEKVPRSLTTVGMPAARVSAT